jgi:hypothetical protein
VKLLGQIDRCDSEFVEGWLLNPDQPEHRIVLQILSGDTLIGECRADSFRQDLHDANFGDGACAFAFRFPTRLARDAVSGVRLRIVGTPAFLMASSPQGETRPHAAAVSAFGHLWIDRSDFVDELGRRHRRAELDEEQCSQLFRFVRDGFLIIPNAVSPRAVAALNDEIDRIWARPPDGLMMETFEPDDVMKYARPELRLRDGRTKLLDVYACSDVVRRATAAVPVVKFLSAVFGGQPKAFQQAAFWKGSQQPMHKDSAYVKVASNPLAMAAAWLALEDVLPGTGELEYFVGSHRAPDFLFGGVSKWMHDYTGDHDRFLQSIIRDAETFGHRRGSFLARAGDVLIYHADLANAAARVTRPNATRRSLLTHFTSADDQPGYRAAGSLLAELGAQNCTFVSEFAPVI